MRSSRGSPPQRAPAYDDVVALSGGPFVRRKDVHRTADHRDLDSWRVESIEQGGARAPPKLRVGHEGVEIEQISDAPAALVQSRVLPLGGYRTMQDASAAIAGRFHGRKRPCAYKSNIQLAPFEAPAFASREIFVLKSQSGGAVADIEDRPSARPMGTACWPRRRR